MQNKDLTQFAKTTAAVMANFKSIATEPLLDMWFDMAADDNVTIEQWTNAARTIMRTRKYTSQPTYADFYEIIYGSPANGTDAATEQTNIVMRQIRDLGSYRTPVFDDPITKSLMASRWSWQAVCSMTETELKWWAKDFVESYQANTRTDTQARIESGGQQTRLRLLAGGIGK